MDGKEEKKGKDILKTIKVKRDTYEELEKMRGIMIFHYGRNVTHDEVIKSLFEHAPRMDVILSPMEEGEVGEDRGGS